MNNNLYIFTYNYFNNEISVKMYAPKFAVSNSKSDSYKILHIFQIF